VAGAALICCSKTSAGLQNSASNEIPLTVHCCMPLGPGAGAIRIDAMLEAVTAFFGIMSAGIFIAHAVDGYRSRL
jgi:hypothetical protein